MVPDTADLDGWAIEPIADLSNVGVHSQSMFSIVKEWIPTLCREHGVEVNGRQRLRHFAIVPVPCATPLGLIELGTRTPGLLRTLGSAT